MRQSFLWIALGLVAAGSGLPQGLEQSATSHQAEGAKKDGLCKVANSCPDQPQPVQPNLVQPQPHSEEPQRLQPEPVKPEPDQPQPVEPVNATEEIPARGCQCVPSYQCMRSATDKDEIIALRLKDQECASDLYMCCEQEDIRTVLPKSSNPTWTCGKRDRNVIGYFDCFRSYQQYEMALFAEFPWTVRVNFSVVPTPDNIYGRLNHRWYRYQPWCSGSLIHPQVVLTAAHCIKGKSNLVVTAGAVSDPGEEFHSQYFSELYPTQDRKVIRVIEHEQFDQSTSFNDVALLILEQPMNMSLPNVGLICLAEDIEDMDNDYCIVSGWGNTDSSMYYFGYRGKQREVVKRVDLPMVSTTQCQESLRQTSLGQNFTLHETLVCAESIEDRGRRDDSYCEFYGGSPLVCRRKNNPYKYVQAGMYLPKTASCGTKTPSVYVNVPHFVNWIYSTLKAQRISFSN